MTSPTAGPPTGAGSVAADRPVYPGWPEDVARGYRERGYWRDETFHDVLRDRAARHGERTAIVDRGGRVTYRRLAERADGLAAGLHTLGIGRGDHVVVQLPNSIELVETFFALLRIGAVPVLALPAHRRTEITQFCALTGAAAYITADRHLGFDYRALAAEVAADRPALRHVLIAGDPGADGRFAIDADVRALESLCAHPVDPGDLPQPPAAEDIALLQLSGGSTGVPKLIPRRHADYLCAIRESLRPCPLGAESVFLAALPTVHNFPLVSPGILGALYAGATVVLAAVPSPDVVFALIESEGVTVTSAVPPLALNWLDAAASTTRDLSSLELLQVGGASCSPETARRVRPELGARLQQVFGMAEGLINYTRTDDPDDVIVGSQGRPCCDADEIRIVDEEDRDVPPGAPGHLLTRGPYTIRGYFDARAYGTAGPGTAYPDLPDPNDGAFTADGYYRTGDLARMRQDGNLVVVGRAKEQINRGGEKVSPEQVENLLLRHEAVHDAAVVGLADTGLGERTCAFVIGRTDGDGPPTPASVKAFLKSEGLAAYKIPDRVEVIDAFPVIGVGKISKAELRRRLTDTFTDPGSRRQQSHAQEG